MGWDSRSENMDRVKRGGFGSVFLEYLGAGWTVEKRGYLSSESC